MASYIVSFFTNDGNKKQTIIRATDLDVAKGKVLEKLSGNEAKTFLALNSKTKHFLIFKEQLSSVDFELVNNTEGDNQFSFEDLLDLEDIVLTKLFQHITDNEMIAKALKGIDEELKEKIYNSVSKSRKLMIKDFEDAFIHVSSYDVEVNQEKILDILRMYQQNGSM